MLPLYHGEKENQRYFCLWSILWSKPLLCRFRQSEEIPQRQVSQGFAAFRLALPRIPTRHSQSRRATNCATPGYSVYLSGWSYSPKCGAVPAPLYPVDSAVGDSPSIPHSGRDFKTFYRVPDHGPGMTVSTKEKAPSSQMVLFGAGDEARTRYLDLGKVALYQMSYARKRKIDYTPGSRICQPLRSAFFSFFSA